MLNKKISFFYIIFILSLSSIYSQEIGKIFTASEANSLFGKVNESTIVSNSVLNEWLNSTNDKVMFKLDKDNLIVLSDHRDLIYSNLSYTESNEVFHMYSKSKVLELLKNGGEANSYFENRSNVFSITNGNYTLEKSTPCPPYCP